MDTIEDIQELFQSIEKKRLRKFDHVVVVMLENRSFDNLLGNLYKPQDFEKIPFSPDQKFAGLHFDGPFFNQVPQEAKDSHEGEKIYTQRASNFNEPYPDPGDSYVHVNTQIFNAFNPIEKKPDHAILNTFNESSDTKKKVPNMEGFVKDYLMVLKGLNKVGLKTLIAKIWRIFLNKNPPWFNQSSHYDGYKSIMECYHNDQIPVLTTLAKEFAVFDHWHCDVPSQTFSNRAFWHSGTSFGFVNNSPIENWFIHKNNPTLFNLLSEKKIDWKVYTDNIVSVTAIIHYQQLMKYTETNFMSFNQFLSDASKGLLPEYSFIEPRFFTAHNDQDAASYDSINDLDTNGKVGSVLQGEKLIREIYNAIKHSKGDNNGNGNTWQNTLLIITHDEHGGYYDHIPPGNAPPPQNMHYPLQEDFQFDRLGLRVPMVMVSAYIKSNTIVNTEMRHTYFLKTMCMKWGLNSLTKRDSTAQDFSEVFNLDEPRDPGTWPDLTELQIPEAFIKKDFSKEPIGKLEKNIIQALSFWKFNTIDHAANVKTKGEAIDFLQKHHFQDQNTNKRFPGANYSDLSD